MRTRLPARLALLLGPVAVALLLGLGGCGGSGGSTSDAAATATVRSGSSPAGSLLGDEDRDNRGETGGYDSDDDSIPYFGRPAGVSDRSAITALVRRYYAAAASEDGAEACTLLYFILAESTPEQYGRAPGPRYLQGADTCQAVLSRVFAHFHAQLTEPPHVTAVRVSGDRGDALLAWTTLRAGFIEVRREGRAWKIDRVLAAPLP
jgi:hypothetical protein